MNLTPLQESDLEAVLRKRRLALVSTIRNNTHRSDDPELLVLGGNAHDVGDWPAGETLIDAEIAMLKTELAELNDIDAALSRIDDGSYGVCVNCGKPISSGRLKAQPTAVRCVGCQEKNERQAGGVQSRGK